MIMIRFYASPLKRFLTLSAFCDKRTPSNNSPDSENDIQVSDIEDTD